MPNNLPSINLVKNQKTPLVDILINWMLTAGRLIVIITEVIAVSAFIYRFSLDERLISLHDSIKDKEKIILDLKSDESKYRNLQSRLSLASTFSTKASNTNQTIVDITKLIPDQTTINSFMMSNDQVSMALDLVSVSSLGSLIDSLNGYHGIKSISVDNVTNKPSGGLLVDITTMLK